jgi:sugar lactone lactonase YvrE
MIAFVDRRMSSEGSGGGGGGGATAGAEAAPSGVQVVELEAAGRVGLGEGPHWVDSEQALYFVDLLAGALHRLHPASGLHTHATPPAGHAPCTLGFVVPVRRRPGLFVAGLARQMVLLRWDGRAPNYDVVAPLGADAVQNGAAVRFNDGKADPTGRLWAGTNRKTTNSRRKFEFENFYILAGKPKFLGFQVQIE